MPECWGPCDVAARVSFATLSTYEPAALSTPTVLQPHGPATTPALHTTSDASDLAAPSSRPRVKPGACPLRCAGTDAHGSADGCGIGSHNYIGHSYIGHNYRPAAGMLGTLRRMRDRKRGRVHGHHWRRRTDGALIRGADRRWTDRRWTDRRWTDKRAGWDRQSDSWMYEWMYGQMDSQPDGCTDARMHGRTRALGALVPYARLSTCAW